MKRPEQILLKDYIYSLPWDRIAKYPLDTRDLSKLLFYNGGRINHYSFRKIAEFLDPANLLVYNNTRVIHARLKFFKPSGSGIEIFCLQPVSPAEHTESFAKKSSVIWKCLVGNAKKWKNDSLYLKIPAAGKQFVLKAEKTGRDGNTFHIRFSWDPDRYSFSEIIEEAGKTPIPPYLNREAEESDKVNYQTVYSHHEGSVAAPTAGLHFTNELLKELTTRGIDQKEITLHVGAGTFTPVKTANAVEHQMHIEAFSVSGKLIESIIAKEGNITAVGTTSCRSLESLYWIGVKIINNSIQPNKISLDQWEAYDLPENYSYKESMNAILEYMKKKELEELHAQTGIMITPGYEFKMIKSLITNFHQPSSTLLMLIASFVGKDWKKIYQYALDHDFRFLSYGDSSLLMPKNSGKQRF